MGEQGETTTARAIGETVETGGVSRSLCLFSLSCSLLVFDSEQEDGEGFETEDGAVDDEEGGKAECEREEVEADAATGFTCRGEDRGVTRITGREGDRTVIGKEEELSEEVVFSSVGIVEEEGGDCMESATTTLDTTPLSAAEDEQASGSTVPVEKPFPFSVFSFCV